MLLFVATPTPLFAPDQASFGTFCIIKLDQPMPRLCRYVPEKHVRGRKRRRSLLENENHGGNAKTDDADRQWLLQPLENRKPKSGDGTGTIANDAESLEELREEIQPTMSERNCTICLQYKSMLHLDFLASKEMVVVEQPWVQVVDKLPDAMQRRVYGVH